ncbi:MAG: restriction endonuclease subunit S [Erysipelotrichaceae bacterium]|nr:restriction endonuclease subunit S [Erysipelotrichaceae bacterium]
MFPNVWEQRKYSEIGVPLSGGSLSYDSLDDENGKYYCVLYGDLYTNYDCIIKNIIHKTDFKGNSIIKNDILFPQSTTVDAFSLISPACLNENRAETSGVFVIRPYKNIDGNFICYYTKGNNNQRMKLSKKAQGLTIVHLYYYSIKDETILIPKYEEQIKISSLLIKIDNLITLHQRLYLFGQKRVYSVVIFISVSNEYEEENKHEYS